VRYIKILGLLFYLAGCHSSANKAGQRPGPFAYYTNDTIQKRLKEIVRTDSTTTTCYLTFKSFDNRDSLVTELKYYQCQNNSKAGYFTRSVYNSMGKLILHETFNMEGLELERH
jgi:hypothetical protein